MSPGRPIRPTAYATRIALFGCIKQKWASPPAAFPKSDHAAATKGHVLLHCCPVDATTVSLEESVHDVQYRDSKAKWYLGGQGLLWRKVCHLMATSAIVFAIQLGVAGDAWAIERVDCFSGPPTPITLITPDGNICFGGSAGNESVGAFVQDFSSGGYHCRVFFLAEGSDTTLVVSFEPGEFSALNVAVIGIEIISPGSD